KFWESVQCSLAYSCKMDERKRVQCSLAYSEHCSLAYIPITWMKEKKCSAYAGFLTLKSNYITM
ncbi:hypothetical protein, partial [Mycobacterium tuberculosis]